MGGKRRVVELSSLAGIRYMRCYWCDRSLGRLSIHILRGVMIVVASQSCCFAQVGTSRTANTRPAMGIRSKAT
ncbi:hypothetical protein HBI70_143560 [Parastagonospora nodorum]|nr:hypothetical protein HBI10_156850 [Parastagonospora nodorum]KAH4019006.1 hypothetical protein HBI13_129210 [Parastagonospora nodorum]KAH4116145.1 hypothetical protein HBH47_169810 [Parastagonospora nodorum]KAH4413352.1 hypothetical protein HBH92_091700 [Parastagonospora nodorum]KAH4431701.1 hypothetical protein HBH93_141660 [Parastagonospora nodorum]